MTGTEKLTKLRLVITENLRVQRGGADPVPYIDVGNVLNDIRARQTTSSSRGAADESLPGLKCP